MVIRPIIKTKSKGDIIMTTAEMVGKGKRFPWWLILLEGILSIIIGLLLLAWPVKAFTTLVFFIGIWWFIDGIFNIVAMFIDHSNWGWKLFMGIIGIIAGLFLMQSPLQGALVLAPTIIIMFGFLGLMYGVIGLINAFQGAGWGAGIMGVISILLGMYLLFNVWAAALALPWVFGVLAIAGGIMEIFLAFRQKKD
jgi:uncharacterized membrane protein HdeD (DUF308 family)